MEQQARFLKTKFYPVSVESREIINDPQPRERDVAWKYKERRGFIGIRGAHLNGHKCYASFVFHKAA